MYQKKRIIGLAGTNGSGKDTVGHILANDHGYLFVSVTDILRNELRHRELPVTRENLRALSAEWRRESGQLGVLVDKAVAELDKDPSKFSGVAIASLRNPGEASRVHELGGLMIWVDAEPQLRYDRIQANETTRARNGEDNKSFEQFLAEEAAEMDKPDGGDEAMLNMSAVKEACDIFLDNGFVELDTLKLTISKALETKQE